MPLLSKRGKRSTVSAPTIDYLIIGGGSGGAYNNYVGAGGGAGGVAQGIGTAITAGVTYTVTVGGGGSGRLAAQGYAGGTAGNLSQITNSSGTVLNGTAKANGAPTPLMNGANSASNSAPTGGTNIYGYSGYANIPSQTTNPGGGGNMAWGGGGDGNSSGPNGTGFPIGSYGGQGTSIMASWPTAQTPTASRIVGGGGGGAIGGAGTRTVPVTSYDNSGGGYGALTATGGVSFAAQPATAGSGGGGGGGGVTCGSQSASNGGLGCVFIRVPSQYKLATTTGSPTITEDSGYIYYKFSGLGTITF